MQLIVLGMHRSGTSILARALNLMGAYFGPEGMSTGANRENPKGFWERRDARALNDAVLQGSGSDWDRVLHFDPDRVDPALHAAFDQRASRLVLELDANRPWFLKEPRLCLLLPMWRKWLEAPVCIHIFRHPAEVASSLRTRNGIPLEAGMLLWERYVRSALAGSAGLPVAHVSHRELINAPTATIERLHAELEQIGVTGLRPATEREVEAFVENRLYRERESRPDLQQYADTAQAALFRMIGSGTRLSGDLPPESDMASLAAYEATLPPLHPLPMPDMVHGQIVVAPPKDQAAAIRELQKQLAKAEAERSPLERRLADEAARNKLQAAAISELEKQLAKAEAERSPLERRLAEEAARSKLQAAAIGELEKQLAKAEAERSSLEHGLVDEAARSKLQAAAIDELEKRLAKAEAERSSLERRVADEAERGNRLASESADLQVQARQQSAAVAELASRRVAAENRAQSAEALAHEFERKAAAAARDIAKLTRRLVQRELELDMAAKVHEREISRLSAVRKALEDEAADLRLQAIDAERHAVAVEQQLQTIVGSLTWRVGKPVRALARLARRWIGRGGDSDHELVRRSGLLNPRWYLERYPDVAESGMDPCEHYLGFGAGEGRDPGPVFSTRRYLELNPDVAGAGMNALVHYLRHGREEGRKTC